MRVDTFLWFHRHSRFPLSFVVPQDLSQLLQYLQTRSAKNASTAEEISESAQVLDLWLIKPPGLGGGHGIEVLTAEELIALAQDAQKYQSTTTTATTGADGSSDGSSLPKLLRHDWVAQKYIANPKTFDGFKHDLRVFFLVTSLDPLVVWSYPNAGIVKFCSKKFASPA